MSESEPKPRGLVGSTLIVIGVVLAFMFVLSVCSQMMTQ